MESKRESARFALIVVALVGTLALVGIAFAQPAPGAKPTTAPAVKPPPTAKPAAKPPATTSPSVKPIAKPPPSATPSAEPAPPTTPTPTPPPPGPSTSASASALGARTADACQTAARDLLRKEKLSPADLANSPVLAKHDDCVRAATAKTTAAPLAPASVGAEILRSVGQVVVNRAQRAGWQVLRDKLVEAAQCDASDASPTFPATCKVLASLSIKDLVASPTVLLRAAVADFLTRANVDPVVVGTVPVLVEEILKYSRSAWQHADEAGLITAIQEALQDRILEEAKGQCSQAKSKALWVIGMCFVEVQSMEHLPECHVEQWSDACAMDPETKTKLLHIFSVAKRVYVPDAKRKPPIADWIELSFASADLAIDSAQLPADQRKKADEYLAGLRSVLTGISERDWVAVTSGAVRVIKVIYAPDAKCAPMAKGEGCKPPDHAKLDEEAKNIEKVLTVLAAVGNYAETFNAASGNKDPATAAAAREKIVEELVDRMVNRTDRDSGVVVSLGGNLGGLLAARTDFKTGSQLAFPAQLGLGVGIQSYHAKTGGFHAMVQAFDLGQYLAVDSGSLKVESPKVESAVVLGASLGFWLALRETPFYIAGFAGSAPFVRVDDKITYEFGAVSGLYVPLLDFN